MLSDAALTVLFAMCLIALMLGFVALAAVAAGYAIISLGGALQLAVGGAVGSWLLTELMR